MELSIEELEKMVEFVNRLGLDKPTHKQFIRAIDEYKLKLRSSKLKLNTK